MSTPATPAPAPAPAAEPTIRQSAEELRAGMTSQPTTDVAPLAAPSPAAPPPAPAAPAPSTFTVKEEGGKVTVTLKTGQVYEGASKDEALARLAEAQVSASELIREFNAAEKQRRQAPAPVAPLEAPAAPDPESEMAAVVWDLIGKDLGLTGTQAKDAMVSLADFQAKVVEANIAHEFAQACPDFPGTEEAQQTLYRYMHDAGMVAVVPNGTDADGNPKSRVVGETAAKLKAAHAACLREGLYTPLTLEEQQSALASSPQPAGARPPQPPPVPSPSSSRGASSGAINPFAAPLDDVRKWAQEEKK